MPLSAKTLKAEFEAALKRAKKTEERILPPAEDESNWLVSYADMMTLLCGFFIMLFSMSKLDEPKYDNFKAEVSKQFGGKYESPPKELAKHLEQFTRNLQVTEGVEIKADPLGVSISFQSTVFFDTLSAEIREQGSEVLTTFIDGILNEQKNTSKQYRIVIEGHTDGRPITGGLYPSNWELSSARAARVARRFIDKGFKPEKLIAIGYADTHPKAMERTDIGSFDPKALIANRRVVLRVLEPTTDSIPMPTEAAIPAY
jgi:chemotaxis protein MotB